MGHLKGISHLAFNVTDLDRAVDFYCNVLGFKYAYDMIVPENIDDILPGHPVCALKGKASLVYLQAPDGGYIELFHPLPDADLTSGGPNYDRMGYVHLSLIVDDLKSFVEELRAKGVTIDSDITLNPDNTYTAWIKDPDGNRIEIFEYTENSLQVVHSIF